MLTLEEAARVDELIEELRRRSFPSGLRGKYGVFSRELRRIDSYLKLKRAANIAQILLYVNTPTFAQKQPTMEEIAKLLLHLKGV